MSQAPPTTVEFVADFAPTARRPLWPLLVAGALLALAAIVATLQAPYRDAYGYGERSVVDWLIRPLEVNPELRLPRVAGNLNDVAFASDGHTGFAVGADGVILETTNGGIDWKPSNKARPSVPPWAASIIRSGWGIMPSTLPAALSTPAMLRAEPLTSSA